MKSKLNRDFYDNLPGFVCTILEELIEEFGKEEWFNQAWEEYRQHILNSSMDDMQMPGYIFQKYIEEE